MCPTGTTTTDQVRLPAGGRPNTNTGGPGGTSPAAPLGTGRDRLGRRDHVPWPHRAAQQQGTRALGGPVEVVGRARSVRPKAHKVETWSPVWANQYWLPRSSGPGRPP
uniref:Uncharacterized protein n=1 Tax=Eutreptiella gymnastica TaxID=73025 RepID=A0A7S1NGM3_9EUGL